MNQKSGSVIADLCFLEASITIYTGELGSSAPVKMVEMVESQAKIAFPTLVSNPELSVHYAYRKRQRF
jgi:hypothetical protein